MTQPTLKRGLSLTLLVLYGLGTTIGAGIYVLVGKVAGESGVFAPLSFMVAALVAAPTAISFGALAARYPRSAGEAVYVEEAYAHPHLSRVVGLAVVFVGLVSSAAIVNGAVGYLQNILTLPDWAGLVLIVGALGLVAVWGITESVTVTAIATVLEIGGLVVIVWFGRGAFDPGNVSTVITEAPRFADIGAVGVLSGAILAFYAFIGFEDMVNVSEEVRDPSRNMPRAIMITLLVTAVLYCLVSWVSVAHMPPEALSGSAAPMSEIFRRLTGWPSFAFDTLVVGAVMNGALVQIIMASRVLYGLAQQGWLPGRFAMIGRHTRTPIVATAAATAGVFMMALVFPIEDLARTTSFVTLLIFALVNLALLRIRGRAPASDWKPPALVVPMVGFAFSLGLAGFQLGSLIFR
jgi:APA family basic amino acid/polyamine antiporter